MEALAPPVVDVEGAVLDVLLLELPVGYVPLIIPVRFEFMMLVPPPFQPTIINTTPKNIAATPSANAINYAPAATLPLEKW